MSLKRIFSPDLGRPGRQPQQAVRLNRSHPMARGLLRLYDPSIPGQPVEYVKGNTVAWVGNSNAVGAARGRASYLASGALLTNTDDDFRLSITNQMSVMWYGEWVASSASMIFTNGPGGSSYNWAIYASGSSGTWDFVPNAASNTYASQAFVANVPVVVIATYDGANCRIYVDGIGNTPVAFTANINTTDSKIIFGDHLNAVGTAKHYFAGIWNRCLSDAEVMLLSKDPYQMLEPVRPPMIGVTVAGGGITASITITEAAETFTAPSNVGITSSITEADPADVFAASSTVTISGTVTVADPADVLAGSSAVGISGSITLAEIADTFAASSNIAISGSLALTDTDAFASIVNVAISGTLAITEGADIFAANVNVGNGLTASITVTEAADAFAASAGVGISGAMSIADQADTLAAQIALAISGAAAVSETGDTLTASGTVAISASLARTDTDLPAAAVNVAISGITSITDPADVFAAVLTAFAIAAASERILSVQAENRSMSVAAELRTISLSTESRTLTIKAE